MNKPSKQRSKEATASSYSRGRRNPLQEINGCSFPRIRPVCFSFLLSPSPTKNHPNTPPRSHLDGNPTPTTPQKPHQVDQGSHKKHLGPSKIPPFSGSTGKKPQPGGKKKPSTPPVQAIPLHSSCSSCSGPSPDSDREEVKWVPSNNNSKEQGKVASLSNLNVPRRPTSRRTIRRKATESLSFNRWLPDSGEKQVDMHRVPSTHLKESGKARALSDLLDGRTPTPGSSISNPLSISERKAEESLRRRKPTTEGCGSRDLFHHTLSSGSSSRFNWSLALNHPWNASLLSSLSCQLDCGSSNREKITSSPDLGARFSWRKGLMSRMIAMEDELDSFSCEVGSSDLSNGSVQSDGGGLGSIQFASEGEREHKSEVVKFVECSDQLSGGTDSVSCSGDSWRIICVNPLFKV